MQNNNPNNYLQEDEIELKEIFKFLINSKKLLIAITLVITILGAIYSFQKVPEYKSTALIEIGGYNTFSNEKGLIEPAKDLIQDLKINFIYKNSSLSNEKGLVDALVFRLIEKKLLQIEYISSSAEKNNNLLNEIVEYIVNRHSLLLEANKLRISNQIKADKLRISNQIKADKLRISNQIKADKFRISNQIESLNNELSITDLKINELNKVIVEDEDNLKLLASNPDLFLQRATQSPTLNQIIFSYNNQLIDLRANKINLSQEKDSLELELKLLESRDSESNDIFNLSQEKDTLEFDLKFPMNQNPTSTQLVGKILIDEVPTNKALPIFLSFIFGLFLSIIVIFINNSLKASKE
jgi:capsular polysaccharide biosynthesis protein